MIRLQNTETVYNWYIKANISQHRLWDWELFFLSVYAVCPLDDQNLFSAYFLKCEINLIFENIFTANKSKNVHLAVLLSKLTGNQMIHI